MELVVNPRGCPFDIYMYELMKEFNENKEKYEPLNGYHVYVRRNNMEGSIKVCKLLESNSDILNDEINGPVYHQYFPYNNNDSNENITTDKKNLYDNSIKVEYNGTDINLNIEPGETAVVCRDTYNQLYVVHKWKIFNNIAFDFLHNMTIRYGICKNYLPNEINSDGKLKKPAQKEPFDWI